MTAEAPITIVSGLPRSGTSMMMKMLHAGGMEPMTDNIRTADVDNPNGYFEFEAVKQTKEDPSWVADAPGKVVKMVYSLLRDLPDGHIYHVVFMRRHMDEVLDSQVRMLQRMELPSDIPKEKMASLFEKELEAIYAWLAERPQFVVQEIHYTDVLTKTDEVVKTLGEFLHCEVDTTAMANIVDPTLYRNRAA